MGEKGEPRAGGQPRRPRPDVDLAALRAQLEAERRAHAPHSPWRTAVPATLALALLGLATLAAWWFWPSQEAADRRAQAKLRRVESQRWSRVEVLSARPERRDPATGEVTSRFQGFAVSVDSSPAGARVLVDGNEMGETPIVASIDCDVGLELEVRVERTGYRAQRRTVRCRADTLVHLSVPLEKVANAGR